MSDELKNLLRQRADEVDVPSMDVGAVMARGRSRKTMMRIGIVAVGAVVVAGAVFAARSTQSLSSTEFAPGGTAPSDLIGPGTVLRVEDIEDEVPSAGSIDDEDPMLLLLDSPVGDLCTWGFPSWVARFAIGDQASSISERVMEASTTVEREGVEMKCYDEVDRRTIDGMKTDPSGYVLVLRDSTAEHNVYGTLSLFEDAPPLPEDRPSQPGELPKHPANAVLNRGDYPQARLLGLREVTSGEALAVSQPGHWDVGNRIHHGNLVAGHAALRQGDIDAAIEYLLEAGRTSGSPQLDSFGPNMSLARDLLLSGERDAVLEYLDLVANFWDDRNGFLPQWREYIEAGAMPDFGANLLYGGLNPAPIDGSSYCAGCALPTERSTPLGRQTEECFMGRTPLVVFFERNADKSAIDAARSAAGRLSGTRGVYKSRVSKTFPQSRRQWAALDPPEAASMTWLHINALDAHQAKRAADRLRSERGVLDARTLSPRQRSDLCEALTN